MTRMIVSRSLLLRPMAISDVEALHRFWIHEQVRRFLWDDKIISLKQTENIIRKSAHLFDQHGFGIWGIREHHSSRLIGLTGYWYFRTPPTLELLFGVAADRWGRGIATESSRCVIRYGFEVLRFRAIEASTDVANRASVKVLEKLGMFFQRRAVIDGLDTVFYSLQRDEWENSRSST
jgi:ribosomal-protein-alanine N-acetyltransferase